MKKDPSIVLVANSDFRDEEINKYLTSKDFKESRKEVNARKYNVGDTDINYRTINHWQKEGLLPEGIQEGSGWRKFTFVEMIWLKVIQRLRNFGFSLEKINVVRDCVMTLNIKGNTYDNFEYFVIQTWKTKDLDSYIVVIADGNADIGTLPEITTVMNYFGHRDIFLVSIVSILNEMSLEVEDKPGLLTLTNKPLTLLKEVYAGDTSEVLVKTSKGDMFEIETLSKADRLFKKEILAQMKNNKEYGEIRDKYEEGVPQSIEVRKRKRFNK